MAVEIFNQENVELQGNACSAPGKVVLYQIQILLNL